MVSLTYAGWLTRAGVHSICYLASEGSKHEGGSEEWAGLVTHRFVLPGRHSYWQRAVTSDSFVFKNYGNDYQSE